MNASARRAFVGCLEREIWRYLQSPLQTILNTVFSNFLLLTVLYFVDPTKIALVLPGVILYATFTVVASNARMALFVGRIEGTLQYLLAAPISRLHLYVINLFAAVLRALLVSLLLLGAGMLCFFRQPPAHPIMFICGWTLMTFTFASIGILLACSYKNWNSFGVMENYVIIPLLFFSGCFFSLEHIPAHYHWLLYANPFSHFSTVLRFGFSGHAELSVPITLLGALTVWLLSTIACALLFRSGRRLLQ
ncbi:MAG: ABC transporter permease [Deltaproteobacteria bacterium]|nr:ABC transporter permease [Deltaproteobacteria bacterium]